MSTTPTRLLCPAALALGLAFTGAHAAELGEAAVRSHIGQPLVADVELVDLSAQDLADLQARLASRDVFQGANVAVNPALAGMGIAIVKRDQRRVLHLTTTMPVQSELLHLYFELGSAGRLSVRGVTLWLTPAPPAPPAPTVQPTRVVATPVPMPVTVPVPPPAPAPVVEAKKAAPAPIRLSTGTVQLAMAGTVGKGGTRADAELLGAVERAFVARAKQPEPLPAPRKAPVDRKPEAEPVTPAAGAKGVDKATMAKAAEVAPAEKKGAAKASAPVPVPVPAPAAAPPVKAQPSPAKAAPAAPPTDPAMLNKLAELEAKLKRLQAMVAAKPAAVAKPISAASVPVAPGRTATGKITDIRAAAVVETKHEATVATQAEAKAENGVVPKAEPKTDAKPEVKAEAKPDAKPEAKAEAKPDAKPEAKPEAKPAKAKAAPPPEPPKEKKMSRPKMLTMAAGAIVALLVVAGVVVHWLRRRKARQASAQIKVWQSWRKKAIAEAAAQPEESSTDSAAEEKAA